MATYREFLTEIISECEADQDFAGIMMFRGLWEELEGAGKLDTPSLFEATEDRSLKLTEAGVEAAKRDGML